jgi:hypothetical protein
MSHVGASGSMLRQAAVLAILVQSVAYCGARAQEMVVRQEPIPNSMWDDMQGSRGTKALDARHGLNSCC